jgi:predicted RNase H-like HicB family nuclease
MSKSKLKALIKGKSFPIILEKDESGLYVVECPLFSGCYSQGKTIDESLKNIREVIELCLEEKYNQDVVLDYFPKEFSFHTVTM